MTDRGVIARVLAGVPLYGWLLLLVVAPNLSLVLSSFQSASGGAMTGGFDAANYGRIFARASYPALILTTIGVAAASAALACVVAYPLALFVSRRLTRWKVFFVLLIVIPLWSSLLIRVFAWKIILGDSGVLNSFLMWTGLSDEPSPYFLYTRFTVFLTFVYVAVPYVFVTCFSALERIPNTLIEASHDAGASAWQTFRRVQLPLSRQGLAVGFMLAFLLAVGDYISPAMVGGMNGTMIGMIIASQFGLAGNWPFGAAIAVVLMVGVGVVIAIATLLARGRGVIEQTGPATARNIRDWRHLPASARIGRALMWMAVGSAYLFLYAPLFITAIFSFNASTLQALPLAGFTLEWYAALAADANLLAALRRSLIVGVAVAVLSALLGTLFALILARVRVPGGEVAGALIAIPVLLPGIVLGISLALAFHFLGLASGLGAVVLGHLTFTVPIVMLVVRTRLRGIDPAIGWASADLGAGPVTTLRRITLPLLASAILAGTLLAFTMSFDEVTVTLFLTGLEPTLPVHIWNQMRFGFTPSINAVFALIGLVSVAAIVTATLLIRDRNTANP